MVYKINKTCATKLEGLQFGVRYVISLHVGFEYDNFFFFFLLPVYQPVHLVQSAGWFQQSVQHCHQCDTGKGEEEK